jgi:hypothetical protein
MINLKLLIIVPVLLFNASCVEKPCMERVPDNFVITDELAITLSKNALAEFGLDISKYEPEPFSDDVDKLFARNAIKPNDGHVLWKEKNSSSGSGYSVFIRRKGADIYCDAGKNL